MMQMASSRTRKRLTNPSRRTLAFALALVLPVLSTEATAHFQILQTVPFALHFVSMAIIACIGGLLPAVLAVTISTLANRFLLPPPHPVGVIVFVRPMILVISASVISVTTRGLRAAASALEVALATLQEQTTALIESQQASKCASWTYDIRERTSWYPGGSEIFGMPFAEVQKLPSPISLVWPEDQPVVRKAFEEMVAGGGPLLVEYRVLWPNGELHWSEARGNPDETEPHLWRGVTFDITERKMAEQALIRSEKLAAMGRLASTIAHEVNNPLEAVTNLLYLARRDESLAPATDEHLAVAERELARIAEITRLALGFIRTSAERRTVEIAEIIEDVVALFRHRLEMKNVDLDLRYEPGVTVRIAPQELRQIATNLLSNALDAASPPHARVTIRVEHDQDRALVWVEDNGSGIAETHLSRIFDPFFSTKDDTGTGIGLWVTRELVEKNEGSISVRSGDLPGDVRTSFRMEFPLGSAPDSSSDGSGNRACLSEDQSAVS